MIVIAHYLLTQPQTYPEFVGDIFPALFQFLDPETAPSEAIDQLLLVASNAATELKHLSTAHKKDIKKKLTEFATTGTCVQARHAAMAFSGIFSESVYPPLIEVWLMNTCMY